MTSANSTCSEQVDHGAPILAAHRFAAVGQMVMLSEIEHEVVRIDDRNHGVEAGHIGKALALLVAEREGLRDRQRLGNARRFDQ